MFLNIRLWLTTLPFLFISAALAEQSNLLRSSVSPEFPNGLHAKYLRVLADEMELELSIVPMPYARRILALKNGQIDIMVGLREQIAVDDNIIYIPPHYEELNIAMFVLAKNQDSFSSIDDLKGHTLATTIGYEPHIEDNFFDRAGLTLVKVTSLQQKIDMLRKERTDFFIHFQQSTQRVLIEKGLSSEIVLSTIQFPYSYNYHFAISGQSPYIEDKQLISDAITRLVKRGQFQLTRQEHYSNSKPSN